MQKVIIIGDLSQIKYDPNVEYIHFLTIHEMVKRKDEFPELKEDIEKYINQYVRSREKTFIFNSNPFIEPITIIVNRNKNHFGNRRRYNRKGNKFHH